MISITKHAFRLFCLFIMGLVLAGCGGSSTISNGQNLAGLTGKANTQKTYTLKIPDNTLGLMIQAAGNPNIQLDLLDNAGNSLGACAEALRCIVDYPLPGTYKLQLSATADYAGVNLSASWGGPSVSVLQNNVALDGLKGDASTVILKSLYIDADQQTLVLDATAVSPVNVRLLDHRGNEYWPCQSGACLVHFVPAGLYYAQITAAAQYDNARLRARWGDSADATLENGAILSGLSGTAGTQFIESIYVPPGVDALALSTTSQQVALQLMSAEGGPAWSRCELNPVSGSDCVASQLSAGLHYVVATLMQDATDFSIAVRFGGADTVTLVSGQPGEPRPAVPGELHLESFYVPEGADSAIFEAGPTVNARIYDNEGQLVCDMQPCALNNLIPGAYFVRLDVWPGMEPSFNTAFALGGPLNATLTAGQSKTVTSHFVHERFVESIEVDAGVDAFAIATSNDHAYMMVIDPNGMLLPGCGSPEICIVSATVPGSYFVSYEFGGPVTEGETQRISLALGGESVATLRSGEPSAPRAGQPGERYLESFFVAPGIDSGAFTTTMNSEARIYTADGRVVCEYQPCFMPNLQPGTYFASIKVWDTAWIPYVNASLALAGPDYSTLGSGRSEQKIVQFVGESGFESFYVEPGVESFAVSANRGRTLMAVHNAQGDVITECWNSIDCVGHAPSPGAYFVRYEHTYMEEANPSYTIALGLAGEDATTLSNGQPGAPVAVVTGDILMESFYVPPGVTSAAFTVPMNSETRIYEADGRLVCEYQPCLLQNLQPGVYVAVVRIWDSWIPFFSASLAMGGAEQATLANGQTKTGNVQFNGETGVESFHAGPGVDSFAIAASPSRKLVYVVNEQGDMIADCWNRALCTGRISTPGTYFLRFGDFDNGSEPEGQRYSVSLALGGEQTATLKPELVQPSRKAQPGDALVQSVYRSSVEEVTAIAVSQNAWTRIYDIDGNLRCENWFCTLENMPAGSYFVSSIVMEHPYLTSVSAAVTLGGADQSDLHNGETLFGLQGTSGSFILKSMYVAGDPPTLYGPTSLHLMQSHPFVQMTLMDEIGIVRAICIPPGGCHLNGLPMRQYYVLMEIMEPIPEATTSLSAAWVGPQSSSLENGIHYTLATPSAEFASVQSFNLTSTSTLALDIDTNAVEALILDEQSNFVMSCTAGACAPMPLPTGRYFLVMYTASYLPPHAGESIQYTLSW